MKSTSVIVHSILFVAVGVLYYLHFSTGVSPQKTNSPVRVADSNPVSHSALIAYVDLDSMNENITFIKNKRKELEAEQRSIENEWENGYRSLENQKNNFLKRGNSITQQEAEEFQDKLIRQQQQIDSRKQTLSQDLSEKSYKFMEGIQKQLKEFLEDYNKDKNYQYILTTGTGLDYLVFKDSTLNITEDVINGMNEKMKGSSK